MTPDANSLARVGVELLNLNPLELRCKKCRAYWQPGRLSSGRLPQGWWRCPIDPQHTIDWDTKGKSSTYKNPSTQTSRLVHNRQNKK
ncbi:MAG TPA: hypothetical protein VF813_11995 [Anaerolineaceae bacterium]